MDEFAAVRLLQIHAYSSDVKNTLLAAKSPKVAAVNEMVVATAAWSQQLDLPDHLSGLSGLQVDGSLVRGAEDILRSLGQHLSGENVPAVLLEAVTSTDWPRGIDWAIDREEALATAGSLLGEEISTADVEDLAYRHKRAVKRLRKDSIAPGFQIGGGAFMAGGVLLSGGAANVVGTAIGTHVLGYSGAAATSAGLALLGGGSLAAGGFGMAGGALLVGTVAHGAMSTSRNLIGAVIARKSSSSFVHELAKLDVRCQLQPQLLPETLKSLRKLEKTLRADWHGVRPDPTQRRKRIAEHLRGIVDDPSSFVDAAKRVKSELPPEEERNLAASVRAIEYEVRHLEAPDWKRAASMVPRTLGAPAVTKLLDWVE